MVWIDPNIGRIIIGRIIPVLKVRMINPMINRIINRMINGLIQMETSD